MNGGHYYPKKLIFIQDELPMPSYSHWEFKNESLCQSTGYDPGGERCFSPTQSHWEAFWKEIEAIGVWNWRDDYTNFGILDGNSWSLQLEFGRQRLKTGGCNGYPGGNSEYIGYSTDSAYGRFIAAFERLTAERENDK